MVLITATIALAAAIVVGTIGLVLLDEMRRPSSELRRLGGLLALVLGGAGMWLLVSAVEVNGAFCGIAVGVVQELFEASVQAASGCSDTRRLHLLLSAACILGGTALVLITRRDRGVSKAEQAAPKADQR
ncbi:hypothetical protein ATK74_2903 [Propionicimonas paludicola]|uniref:Uncharacterized protein n=1 Tax=Propionicimonas paludicola TaxID=185243 RepID=A0A2A9CXK9_9ACTN|nr:hypothetical protein [Propionicimonas paludicola]PFG18319.1 hypothetical protein ATK74_2903 [Propionicimonas paludicola]